MLVVMVVTAYDMHVKLLSYSRVEADLLLSSMYRARQLRVLLLLLLCMSFFAARDAVCVFFLYIHKQQQPHKQRAARHST